VSFLNVTLGEVVFSKAGRDRGKKFVIIDIEDTNYVFVSDGDLRRIDKPKKKKIKHLEFTGIVIDSLNVKLKNNMKITNSEIRKVLAAFEEEAESSCR
jgi:large subunit ribosomal protein L14e